jgi:HEAT repeat protein
VEQIWRHIDELDDPSGADALAEYLNKDLHPHWSYRVGRALASVGDMRGVKPLVTRLRQQTEKIYGDETDQEQLLKRNNNERVEAARLLADLAVIHPEKLDELRENSEHAVWSWMTSLPMPHANGLRALTRMKSTLHKAKLREWADPNEPLPLEGQQPPMPDAWVIAQSALRYLGMQGEAAALYDAYSRSARSVGSQIEALVRLATVKSNDERASSAALERAIQVYKARKNAVDDRGKYYAAKARYMQGETILKRFQEVKIEGVEGELLGRAKLPAVRQLADDGYAQAVRPRGQVAHEQPLHAALLQGFEFLEAVDVMRGR